MVASARQFLAANQSFRAGLRSNMTLRRSLAGLARTVVLVADQPAELGH
jgi:hypothetical protein